MCMCVECMCYNHILLDTVVDDARKRSTRLEKERGKEGKSESAGFFVKVNVCLTR